MSIFEYIARREREMEEELTSLGHVLLGLEDDPTRVDFFAYSPDGHNGPVCVRCHESWCVHCWSGKFPLTLCDGR